MSIDVSERTYLALGKILSKAGSFSFFTALALSISFVNSGALDIMIIILGLLAPTLPPSTSMGSATIFLSFAYPNLTEILR